MERMCAFMARNHPDEDWMKEMMAAGNIKTGGQPEQDPAPMLQSNNILVNILDKSGGDIEVGCVEESMENVATTKSDPKEAQFANDCTSEDIKNRTGKASTRKESRELQTTQQVIVSGRVNTTVIQHKVNETAKSNEIVRASKEDIKNRTGKASTRKESPEQQTAQQVNVSRRVNTTVIQHKVNETAKSNEIVRTSKENTKHARNSTSKEHCQNTSSAHEQGFVKASTTKELPKHKATQKKPNTVILVSLAPGTKGLVVGKGIIKSKDSQYMVDGDKLGDAFWAIAVVDVTRLGRERLPRPFGDIQTVYDAIGHCIAWPSTHVKRGKNDSN